MVAEQVGFLIKDDLSQRDAGLMEVEERVFGSDLILTLAGKLPLLWKVSLDVEPLIVPLVWPDPRTG